MSKKIFLHKIFRAVYKYENLQFIYHEKNAVAFSFNWLFAVLVGGLILFLAIYAAGRFIDTSQNTIYTETAASLISFFDPMQTGLASGESRIISFKKQSKIYFSCSTSNNKPFGSQTISFTEKTFNERYADSSEKVLIKDKYIFTEDSVEGKELYIFSVPFFMPFKVSDLMMVYSEKYCVYDAPDSFKEDVEGMQLKNIELVNKSQKCEGINICFSGGRNCDIDIDQKNGFVEKNRERLFYSGNLLYGAIFSSKNIYECNIKRIKSRFDELAKIYIDKIKIMERNGCDPKIGPLLTSFTGGVSNSKELADIYSQIQEIDNINKRAKDGCKLYYTSEW